MLTRCLRALVSATFTRLPSDTWSLPAWVVVVERMTTSFSAPCKSKRAPRRVKEEGEPLWDAFQADQDRIMY